MLGCARALYGTLQSQPRHKTEAPASVQQQRAREQINSMHNAVPCSPQAAPRSTPSSSRARRCGARACHRPMSARVRTSTALMHSACPSYASRIISLSYDPVPELLCSADIYISVFLDRLLVRCSNFMLAARVRCLPDIIACLRASLNVCTAPAVRGRAQLPI